jgi:hypothetical protein
LDSLDGLSFNRFRLNVVGVCDAVWTGGARLASKITVWINCDVTELSLWWTIGILYGNIFWINVAREWEECMFPVPVLKFDKIK